MAQQVIQPVVVMGGAVKVFIGPRLVEPGVLQPTDYFLTTNQVLGIRETGEINQQRNEIENNDFESTSEEFVPGLKASAEWPVTMTLQAGKYAQFKKWDDDGTPMLIGIQYHDMAKKPVLFQGARGYLFGVTVSSGTVGDIITIVANFKLDNILDIKPEDVTGGGGGG